jgi:Leucine-rich repeat (LRR) protein
MQLRVMRCILLICFLSVSGITVAQQEQLPEADTARVYRSMESALQNPEKVYKLNLSKKKLRNVPPEIYKLTNLKELDLSKNKIKELPAEIGQLQSLERLNLSSNDIIVIPDEIGKLKSLVYLGLNRNLIELLPPSIGQLSSLEILELWDNEIQAIPDEIGQLTKLRELELRGILFSDEEQNRIKALVPQTQVYFSPSCNCLN